MRVNQISSLSTHHSFSLLLSPGPPVMQEAEAGIESRSDQGGADAMAAGKFTFVSVAIRVDLLLHLIRENCVVKLSLFSAEIASSGLVCIFDALGNSGAITALCLVDIHFDEIALKALATLMKRSKSIVDYSLRELNIQDDGVALICNGLVENIVIEHLDLSQNGFEVEGARSLARFLKANRCKSFASLSVAANFIYDEGVVALVDGLKSNESLRALNVSYSGIFDDGAIALASLLEHGSHLVELDLNENEIGEAGLMALAKALNHNQNLQDLYVYFDSGGDGEGIENAFVDVFQSNVALLKLRDIRSSRIDTLLLRNKELIPAAVRRAALLLIGIRRSTDFEGMGDFAVFPKDIVRLIAQTVYATRRDPLWIQALK